ncbi:metalloregulator ArsR/SmtB family transcription factor [Actinopolymorpha pittospori]|uniref:DNA-binding transcriptional ArsR family regulator n=1 Tax=Actinopolymorpha pittospori TaxID=648752 RepID=A0A927NDR7_9ACTN|nr:DNA-binding transcriptional ArsR family regulator [Actinopolymorpha pittospori]
MSAPSAGVEAMSRLGRAIADPTRCRMLLAMVAGPVYPAQLAEALDLTRSNVSNHLTFLRGCGLVAATPQGRQVRYELASPHLAHALLEFLQVVGEADRPDVCDVEVESQVAVPPAASSAATEAGRRPTQPVSGAPHGSHRSRPARSHEAAPTRAHHRPGRRSTSAEESD